MAGFGGGLTDRLRLVVEGHDKGAGKMFDGLARSGKHAGDQVDRNAGLFDKLGAKAGVSGNAIKAGLGGAAVAGLGVLTAGLVSTANSASDLNEQTSASIVTFGKAAREAQAFGKSAAAGIGLSRTAALEATNTFGAFFGNIGLSDEASAKFSTTMVQLAGDIASLRNVAGGAAQVAQDLRSGLSGESEPLRKYGIFIDEAATKNKAFELGLQGANGELSTGAKILARQQLILEQSAKAQGDFSRTSTSLANTQRVLAAESENVSANLGKLSGPIILGAKAGLNDLLGIADALSTKLGGLADKGDKTNKWMEAATGFLTGGLLGAYGRFSAASAESGGAQDRYNIALARYKELVDKGTASSDTLRSAFQQVKNASGELERQQAQTARGMKDESDLAKELRGNLFGLVDAQRAQQASLRSVDEAQRTVGEKRRTLNDLLRQGAVDTKAVTAAEAGLVSASKTVVTAQERVRTTLEALNKQLRSASRSDLDEANLSLREATLGVAEAQDQAEQAQLDLITAQEAGDPEGIDDAQRRITASTIGVERALRAQVAAQQAVNDLNPLSVAGQKRIAEAADAYEQAQLDLTTAHRGVEQATRDLQTAQAGDPEFADKLATARRDLAVAEQGVSDAQFAAVKSAAALRDVSNEYGYALRFVGDEAANVRAQLLGIAAINPTLAGDARFLAGMVPNAPMMGQITGSLGPGGVGRRASGGPVTAGGAYLVGENGPELLTMGSNAMGYVHPNRSMASMGGTTVVQLNINHPLTDRAQAEYVARLVSEHLGRGGQITNGRGGKIVVA